MLDTHGRKYVEPIIEKAADLLARWGLSPNQVTLSSFLVGLSAGVLVYLGWTITAIITLWFSGFLDAVDGTMARRTQTTPWGTVLDITLDRVVELSIIMALAFRLPQTAWALLLLCGAIIISMTVFLTMGAVSEKRGTKSFYYQAGLAERTEGFIMFSLMIFFSGHMIQLTLVFFALIMVTAGQRLWEAKKILG